MPRQSTKENILDNESELHLVKPKKSDKKEAPLEEASQTIITFKPTYQNYSWGKISKNSLVSKFLEYVEDETPYAELWIGAHNKAPGKTTDGDLLNNVIAKNSKNYLGKIEKDFGGELPFLLKILSINLPLSIQAHPDKELAGKLNYMRPDLYPDANHKPEMGIALDDVDLLIGFRDPKEIKEYTEKFPAIKIAADFVDPTQDLKLFFKNIFDYPKQGLPYLFNSIVRKLKSFPKESHTPWERYFLKTYEELFPDGDHGLFCFFLLKFLHLQKGDAIEIKANTLHCYLKGDLLECMANSDNVVRAGLTNKHCDASTLIEMLNYKSHEHSLETRVEQKDSLTISKYITSVKDFMVTCVEGTCENYEVKTNGNPILIFNFEGELYYNKNSNEESSNETKIVQTEEPLVFKFKTPFVANEDKKVYIGKTLCPNTQALFIPACTKKVSLKLNNAKAFIVSINDLIK